MPLSSGQVINNRYRIVKLLGSGGFGAVYRAWDLNLSRPCALKENLETSPEAQQQFHREAMLLSSLNHPNLPRVTDHFFVPEQGQYLVMDFVEGQDLQTLLDQSTHTVPESQAVAWVEQVCEALEYLHSQNPPIIHRDLKPKNIIITPTGQARLVDFGIAKQYDPARKTTVGARAVTPGYSPQEQYGQGKTDARSDVYALGATLYALLTGQTPVESVQRIYHPLPSPRALNRTISPKLEQWILRAMEPAPEQRFQQVAEAKAALRVSSMPAAVMTSPPGTQVQRKKRNAARASQPAWAIAGLILAVFLLFGSAVVLLFGPESGTPAPEAYTSAPRQNVSLTQASTATKARLPAAKPTATQAPTLSQPTFTNTLIPTQLPSLTLAAVQPSPTAGDLSSIAYSIRTADGAKIVLINPDGTNRRLLANQPNHSEVPNFSPDGTRLAFTALTGGKPQIFVIGVDGNGLAQLTSGSANKDAAWSPEGRRLAYVSTRNGNDEIYIMNADGSNQLRLTDYDDTDGDPTWSPDGTKIAFERNEGNRWSIMVMNANGSNVRKLMGEGRMNTTPAWSPDGKQIAFERKVGDQWGIYVMYRDGSNVRKLASIGQINYRPAWSPDSTQIAWRSDRSGSMEIWIMNADGSGVRQLTVEGGAYEPAWGARR